MAKILYAINGEGMGHAMRSIAIIHELSKEHTVQIIVGSNRSMPILKRQFSHVYCIDGLRFTYENDSVSGAKTIKNALRKLFSKGSANAKKIRAIIKRFRPDVIISDYEQATIQIAAIFSIPVICICNIHAITHLHYTVPGKYKSLQRKVKMYMAVLTPHIKHHLITSFFPARPKKPHVQVVAPIIRKEILRLKPCYKKHILVYQTSSTNTQIIPILRATPFNFIVYGFNKNEKNHNIVLRTFNEDQFLEDLRTCNALITNGGFTLITEALALHKPILSIPIRRQFEQILNALFVEKLGYGKMYEQLTKENIELFIKNSSMYRKRLSTYHQPSIDGTIEKINHLIKQEMQEKHS